MQRADRGLHVMDAVVAQNDIIFVRVVSSMAFHRVADKLAVSMIALCLHAWREVRRDSSLIATVHGASEAWLVCPGVLAQYSHRLGRPQPQ